MRHAIFPLFLGMVKITLKYMTNSRAIQNIWLDLVTLFEFSDYAALLSSQISKESPQPSSERGDKGK